jgi:hypothetical protein
MVDDNDDETYNKDEIVFVKNTCDREMWDEQVTVGLYHVFVFPHTKDNIEHKLFHQARGVRVLNFGG